MQQSEFLNIVLPFKDKLYRMAKRLLVSNEEAEDATQEIMLKLWAKEKAIYSYTNVEAFAMTMTKNFCLDRLKSKQAGNLKLVHTNYEDKNASVQRQLETKDSLAWVKKIMDQLPENQKMVLQLRDVEQFEFDEIAKMLDMKAGTVRVILSRARKTVKENLEKNIVMESHKIEKLLEKYFDATTTVAEEQFLRDYFKQDNVAPHLTKHAPIFNYVSSAKKEVLDAPIFVKSASNKGYLKWASVAAIAVFIISFYMSQNTEKTLKETYTQEEIDTAQEALSLLASSFNKGTTKIIHLEEFEKNTTKFLSK